MHSRVSLDTASPVRCETGFPFQRGSWLRRVRSSVATPHLQLTCNAYSLLPECDATLSEQDERDPNAQCKRFAWI